MSQFEPEFNQAVEEIEKSIQPYLDQHPEIVQSGILDRLKVPDRSIIFKVTWMDDNNQLQVNTGYRVQFNNCLGPYKGGIRFDASVNLSIMKFLAYEQIFKNALTGLPMGGGKGGSDFNPRDKSEGEIQRFCQAYMTELVKYIGPNMDIPAGDIGVRAREIGFMLGQYKRLTGLSDGVLTGKPLTSGGSRLRPEATGYGLLYILEYAMDDFDASIQGQRVLISGAGNVGLHAAEKAAQLGAKVIGISDINGVLFDEVGLDIPLLKALKFDDNKELYDYVDIYPHSSYVNDRNKIYYQETDIFLFCATQNEASLDEVKALIESGCKFMAEGANMPLTNEAQDYVLESGILYLPGKAANAGGVSVSLMEMSQNATFLPWQNHEVDLQLKHIMEDIYDLISKTAKEYNQPHNFVLGANIAGFRKVVEAMKQQGF